MVPLVSIVTPTLKPAPIPAAVDGKRSFTGLFSDRVPSGRQHSDDGTGAILRSYDGRVRTIFAAREGPASAIHTGLTQAHGSIFAWLGADNVYEPAAVKSAVSLAQSIPAQTWFTAMRPGSMTWARSSAALSDHAVRPGSTCSSLFYQPAGILLPCAGISAMQFRSVARTLVRLRPVDSSGSGRAPLRVSAPDAGALPDAPRVPYARVSPPGFRSNHGSVAKTLRLRSAAVDLRLSLVPVRHGGDQFFEPLRFSPAVFAFSLLYGPAANRTHARRFLAEWIRTGARGVRQLSQLASGSAVNQATAPGRSPAESPEAAE